MVVIKVNYTSVSPIIKITYDETPVYVKTSVNNVYAKVVYGSGGISSVSWGDIDGTLSNQTDLQNALNAKQNTLTLTTTGSSGASTLVGSTLNIPQYSGNAGTVTSVGLSMPSAFTVTNSPITSSGTIGVTGAGTTAQYIRGDGTLATLPSTSDAVNLITEVYNETGATLTKGTVVYINGGHGNLPTVTKAIATGDATSAQTFGIVRTDITNMNNGYVIQVGLISDLDTQAFADGTQLYLSSTTAGAYTSTKQYAPNHLVYIGVVVRAHPTQGTIQIKIQNGYEMDELHNVSAQTPSDNDGLFYETSTSLWKNKSIPTILGYTPEQPLTFSSPLSRSTNAISIPVATSSANGYLSSTDWSTFNGKYTLPSLTSGSVLFSNGTTIAQDNTNLFWDDSNNRLGIGTTTPSNKLSIVETTNISTGFNVTNTTVGTSNSLNMNLIADTSAGYVQFQKRSSTHTATGIAGTSSGLLYNSEGDLIIGTGGASSWIKFATNGITTADMNLTANGRLLLGTTTESTYILDVNGTVRVQNAATFSSSVTAASLIKSGGTSAQILAADGSVITAGTNITISGGTISASGGGGSFSANGDVINTSQTTTSTTYTDLATVGPVATVTIGSSGNAIVTLTAELMTGTNGAECYMSFNANGVTPNDDQALTSATRNSGDFPKQSATFWVTGLTPGSNTFTAKYRTTAGTLTAADRNIIVIPV